MALRGVAVSPTAVPARQNLTGSGGAAAIPLSSLSEIRWRP